MGALLRTSEGGVGCLHPWPELGDASFADEVLALSYGQPLPLGARVLECARTDGVARQAGRSLWSIQSSVPESYISLSPDVSDEELLAFAEAGFTGAKVKSMAEVGLLASKLARWHVLLPEWKWRIDFNGTGSPHDISGTFGRLSSACEYNIAYWEDPFPWDPLQWKGLAESLDVPLALDFIPKDAVFDENSYIPEYQIWKPAREECPKLVSPNLVVTSYMDHPIGTAWAAYEALCARFRKCPVTTCGLMTHGLYEKNDFSERLGAPSPVFPEIEGTGLGFDDLIEKIKWKKL